MENRKYRCSMTPFICSIVPIVSACFMGLLAIAFPARWGCFAPNSFIDTVKAAIPCCAIPLIALMMVPMGIYSIISAVAEFGVPEVRGKMLLVVAIVLGILDIAAGGVFLLYLFSKVF